MNIFKTFSLKKKFFILFFICIATFVGFGTFALIELDNLAQVTQKLYNQSSKVSDAAVKANLDLIKISSSIKDVILLSNSDEIQSEINKVTKYEDDLQKNLDIIEENSDDSNTKRNLKDANDLLSKWWKPQREKIIADVQHGKKNEAIEISKGISSDFAEQLELHLNNIYLTSSDNQISLIKESNKLQDSERITLIITLVILIIILTLAFIMVIMSIIIPINKLKEHMIKTSNSGDLDEYKVTQKNELGEMAKSYNKLINKLKNEFWINDIRNSLNEQMTGNNSVKELTQKAINFLSRSLDAGNGTFYIHNNKENKLSLNSSFAFTERERLSNTYEFGEGIVGQVALEKQPILLKNIRKSENTICTGTINEAPSNIYAFPLIYDNELYGVIELSSFETFNVLKQGLIEVASNIIATNLYSAIQNEQIKKLLEVSEKSKKEAQEVSIQLVNTNEVLEEQQRQLQVQTEELQQTNCQLEEHQQILEQQSEEMQQTNAQLEENQLQMEEQSRLLRVKNEELEKSKIEILAKSKDYEMANKYKTQFLANMSHELRTPFNSIILLSKLLINSRKDIASKDEQEKIKVIYKAGQDLLRLINDILDLSKIEAGKIDLDYKHFNSSEIIEELSGLFNESAIEKGIKFICEDKFEYSIYGDQERICQVLKNFLSNAFKFTDNGSVKVKIERDTEWGNNLLFSVIDTGIGISKDKLDMIFDEFHQADGSISRKYGGTGLGLAISNRLSELMNGKIKVISEIGMGSTFSLYLPLIVQEQAVYEEEEIVATSSEKEYKNMITSKINKDSALNLDNKKILIVDDDARNIFVLAAALEEYGAEIIEAENGKVALEILENEVCDLILMDIMMPVMNGYEAIKAIRSNDSIKHIPIIATTAKSLKDDREKCMEAGANDYISKPIDYEVLITLIKAWINKA